MKNDKPILPSPLEIANDLLNPFKDVLLKGGIDDKLLIKQLKKELRSKEPKIIKVKGSVKQEDLPLGFKVIADTGTVYEGEKGAVNLEGETIIQYKVANIGTMQKARMDVHRLRGDYPAEKHDVDHTAEVKIIVEYEDKLPNEDDDD
jgi:hypothetical protein